MHPVLKRCAQIKSEATTRGGFSILFTFLLLLFTCTKACAVSAPTITPSNNSFTTPQNVIITGDPGSSFYYSLDGSQPSNTSSTSFLYTGQFLVSSPTQINAIAYASGVPSTVSTSFLDVDPALMPMLQNIWGQISPVLRMRSTFGVIAGKGAPAPVFQWTDLSGNSNHATGVFNTQPNLISYFGTPAINFNGSGQYLTLPSGFTDFQSGGAIAFAVVAPNSLADGTTIFDLGQGTSGNNVAVKISTSGGNSYGALWSYNGTTGTSVTSSANLLKTNQPQLLEGLLAKPVPSTNPTTTGSFYLNTLLGQTSTSLNTPAFSARTHNFLGQATAGGSYFNGNIIELLIYMPAPPIRQIQSIEAYFASKYQLLSPHSGQPITARPDPPLISLNTSTLLSPQQVTVTAAPGTILYVTATTTGTTPDPSTTPPYNGCPIQINYTQIVKAIAVKNGISSDVSSATYTLDATQWPAPSPTDTSAPSITPQLPTASH